jgi:hypothetical protein
MRKIIVVLIALAFSISLFAQSERLRLGLTASPMLSWTKPDKAFDSGKLRMGFEYGLITDIGFNDDGNYGISTGILLSLSGGNIEGPIQTSSLAIPSATTVTSKLQYISMPLLLKLKTNKINDKISVYGKFGTLQSFRYRAKGDFKNSIDDETGVNIAKKINSADNPYTVKSRFFNLSVQAGAGIEYYVSERTSIITGIFYNHGFLPVLREDITRSEATLSNLGLRLGVMF